MSVKVIIVGHGASGKDTLKARMVEKGMKKEISYTTRSPRSTEKEAVDYYFISEEEFLRKIDQKFFVQYNKFGNGKYYGTSRIEFDRNDVFIMTPSALLQLSPEDRKRSFVIFINVDEEIRRERLSSRSDAFDTDRRLKDDKSDFEGFTDYDMLVTNPDF